MFPIVLNLGGVGMTQLNPWGCQSGDLELTRAYKKGKAVTLGNSS
jgi:hypothetical protein